MVDGFGLGRGPGVTGIGRPVVVGKCKVDPTFSPAAVAASLIHLAANCFLERGDKLSEIFSFLWLLLQVL